MVRGRIAGAFAALAVALGGCGSDDPDAEEPPATPFAAALATVGGHGANGSLGVGWAEPDRVARIGATRDLTATALAPNAASVVQAAPQLRRRFGLDPLAARRLVSVGGSYAFGLRLDGVSAPRLERALLAAGGREHDRNGVTEVEAAGYASVPDPLLRAGILGLGARDAFAPDRTVLAISDTARAALLGEGERLLDEPTYAAAAECLGDDIAVARLVPAKLLLSTELGFEQVAIGVAADREILCVLTDSADRAAELAGVMKSSFAAGAREPRTHEPITDYVSGASVTTAERDGVGIARAELTPAAGQPPGFLLETVARGSISTLITGR